MLIKKLLILNFQLKGRRKLKGMGWSTFNPLCSFLSGGFRIFDLFSPLVHSLSTSSSHWAQRSPDSYPNEFGSVKDSKRLKKDSKIPKKNSESLKKFQKDSKIGTKYPQRNSSLLKNQTLSWSTTIQSDWAWWIRGPLLDWNWTRKREEKRGKEKGNNTLQAEGSSQLYLAEPKSGRPKPE